MTEESRSLVRATPSKSADVAAEYGLGILKGAIGAVPYVGSFLNEVLFEARSRLKQRRLEEFFHGVAEAVGRLGEDSIDREYLSTDEFSDLVEEICQRVARTTRADKRKVFQAVLVDAFQGVRQPDFRTVFLSILDELTLDELAVFTGFVWAYERAKQLHAEGTKWDMTPIDYSSAEIKGYAPQTYRQLIQSLVRQGLLFDDSHGRFDTSPFSVMMATDLGAAFYRWLNIPAAEDQETSH